MNVLLFVMCACILKGLQNQLYFKRAYLVNKSAVSYEKLLDFTFKVFVECLAAPPIKILTGL